jgi:hypothetical protein
MAYGSSPLDIDRQVTPTYSKMPGQAPTMPLRDTYQAPKPAVSMPNLGGIVNVTRPPGYNPMQPNQQMAQQQYERLAMTSPASVSGAQRRAVAAKVAGEQATATAQAQQAEDEAMGIPKGLTGKAREAYITKMAVEGAKTSRMEKQQGLITDRADKLQAIRSGDKQAALEYGRETDQLLLQAKQANETGNMELSQKYKLEAMDRKNQYDVAMGITDYENQVKLEMANHGIKNSTDLARDYYKQAAKARLEADSNPMADKGNLNRQADAYEAKAQAAITMANQVKPPQATATAKPPTTISDNHYNQTVAMLDNPKAYGLTPADEAKLKLIQQAYMKQLKGAEAK